uniref:Uncharacterized protein n=1 Tax=Lepeophtheirus salmonis TaxID=72036 RepID=A0A0K2TPK7_LEPSM
MFSFLIIINLINLLPPKIADMECCNESGLKQSIIIYGVTSLPQKCKL